MIEYHSHSRDLFADLECTCPNDRFVGTPIDHLMKHKIKLSGYNDDYFFDVVNKEPQRNKCKCGREYQVQWFREGVDAFFIDSEEP